MFFCISEARNLRDALSRRIAANLAALASGYGGEELVLYNAPLLAAALFTKTDVNAILAISSSRTCFEVRSVLAALFSY